MTKSVCVALFLIIAGLSFTGCTTTEKPSVVSTQDFEVDASPSVAIPKMIALSVDDVLECSVEVDGRNEVARQQVRINSSGSVTLPLVGDVLVAGLKLDEARTVIQLTYAKYYVSPPVVMLNFIDDDADGGLWGYIVVTGRVNRPGQIPLRSAGGMKLTEAIQLAGGFAASAKMTDIRVSRTDESGKKERVYVNYKDIGQEGDIGSDITLISGDVLYVPERIF